MLHIEWHEYKSKTLARLHRAVDDAELAPAVGRFMAGLTVGTQDLLAKQPTEQSQTQGAGTYSNAQPAN